MQQLRGQQHAVFLCRHNCVNSKPIPAFRKIKTRITLRQKALNELDSTITRPRLDAGVWLVHYGSKGNDKELEGVGRKVVGV